MFKRSRENDGQIRREDYDRNETNHDIISSSTGSNISFAKASADVMASRKIVSARKSRKDEFLRHMKALNTFFLNWIKSQDNKSLALVEGCYDYLDYCQDLQQRYLKTYGEVLTFGSGDCGQLAHGSEEDNDLMVKYPRIVYSLRDKKVCGIACGGLHNAVYTETGQVYTWGCSDDGSLGRVGDEGMPVLVDALAHENIIGVACGDGQTLALTSSGSVYGWGCYKDKEGNKWFNPSSSSVSSSSSSSVSSGWKDIRKQQNEPLLISGLHNIIELCCGSSYNLARDDIGHVYSWGIGECGELGREVVEIKAGRGDADEKMYQAILDTHITPGRMYHQPSSSSSSGIMSSSSKLVAIDNVKGIGCGSYHAMVITVGGKVYSTGLNNYAQLGLGHTTNQKLLNEVIIIPYSSSMMICSIKGGMHHTLALTSSHTMLAWGRSDYCQLGNQPSASHVSAAGSYATEAVIPYIPSDIIIHEIACGGNHNLALASSSTSSSTSSSISSSSMMVYTWGYGDMLALGHGKDQDEPVPRRIDFQKGAKIPNITVTQVAGGGQHSAIIGRVIST